MTKTQYEAIEALTFLRRCHGRRAGGRASIPKNAFG